MHANGQARRAGNTFSGGPVPALLPHTRRTFATAVRSGGPGQVRRPGRARGFRRTPGALTATVARMADESFTHPRLAALYDPLQADRGDLDAYLDLAGRLGARTVLDIGCGTGVFALLLAARGPRSSAWTRPGPASTWPGPNPAPSTCAGSTATPSPCRRRRSTSWP